MDQDETWHAGIGVGPGYIALDGDPAPFPKGHSPQFSAHICCGQMAGWIKMPLGTEVGIDPDNFMLESIQPFGNNSVGCHSLRRNISTNYWYYFYFVVKMHTVTRSDDARYLLKNSTNCLVSN